MVSKLIIIFEKGQRLNCEKTTEEYLSKIYSLSSSIVNFTNACQHGTPANKQGARKVDIVLNIF